MTRKQIVYWSVPTSSIGVAKDLKSHADFWVRKASIFDAQGADTGNTVRNPLFLNLSTGSNQSMNAINALVGHLTGIEYPHTLDGRRHPQ